MTKKRSLADMLADLMDLTNKYDFSGDDKLLFMDKCLLLGEAMAMIEELGLFTELNERHTKVWREFMEMIEK